MDDGYFDSFPSPYGESGQEERKQLFFVLNFLLLTAGIHKEECLILQSFLEKLNIK